MNIYPKFPHFLIYLGKMR